MSRCAELNRGPTPYHGVALPAELQRRYRFKYFVAQSILLLQT